MFLAFWIQYPLGTYLNWESMSDRIRITGVYYFLNNIGAVRIMSSLYWKQFISLFHSYFRRNVDLYREYCALSESRLFRFSAFPLFRFHCLFLDEYLLSYTSAAQLIRFSHSRYGCFHLSDSRHTRCLVPRPISELPCLVLTVPNTSLRLHIPPYKNMDAKA